MTTCQEPMYTIVFYISFFENGSRSAVKVLTNYKRDLKSRKEIKNIFNRVRIIL